MSLAGVAPPKVFPKFSMYEHAKRVRETLESLNEYNNFKQLIDAKLDYESKAVELGIILENMFDYVNKVMMLQDLVVQRRPTHVRGCGRFGVSQHII